MQTPNASDDSSWWDDLIAGLSQKQVAPPPAPQPPPVNQAPGRNQSSKPTSAIPWGRCTILVLSFHFQRDAILLRPTGLE